MWGACGGSGEDPAHQGNLLHAVDLREPLGALPLALLQLPQLPGGPGPRGGGSVGGSRAQEFKDSSVYREEDIHEYQKPKRDAATKPTLELEQYYVLFSSSTQKGGSWRGQGRSRGRNVT